MRLTKEELNKLSQEEINKHLAEVLVYEEEISQVLNQKINSDIKYYIGKFIMVEAHGQIYYMKTKSIHRNEFSKIMRIDGIIMTVDKNSFWFDIKDSFVSFNYEEIEIHEISKDDFIRAYQECTQRFQNMLIEKI